jgi:CubicO group peptidase (beta-lactamase class C family)
MPGSAPSDATGPASPRRLERFLDPLFTSLMRKYQIPGAALVLVTGGKIFFAKGYGWANIARKIPVDPGRTVFRVASITKLFTTAAVMQLAARGKLDLHANVNRYLKLFQLPEKYPQPVTLSALLTHTAGFEDLSIGVAARDPGRAEPLGFYLAHHMPAQVRPPGRIISYSNHGMALAGYIVETVSGQPYAAYAQKNIFAPLAMNHSGFLPSRRLERDLASGYERWRGLHAVPYDGFNIQPASGLCSTADDVAHFIIAMLNGGRYDGAQILSPPSVARMERQHFTQDPRLPGRAYGFYEKQFNGLRVIGHGGDIRGFGSMLTLVPEKRLGLFIAENVDEPRFDHAIERRFFHHYFPAAPPAIGPVRDSPGDARRVRGSYRLNPYSATTFAKLFTLYWQYRVTANADGSIKLHYPHHYRPPSRWVEVGPLYYERPDTGDKAVFRSAPDGHITRLFTDEQAFDRLAGYAVAGFQVRLVETLLLIFLSALLLWPAEVLFWATRRWIARSRGKVPWAPASSRQAQDSSDQASWAAQPARNHFQPRCGRGFQLGAVLARWTGAAAGALVIFFVLAFLAAFRRIDLWDFAYGVPRVIRELLIIPPVTAVLATALVIFSVCSWLKPWWSVFGRVHYTILTLAAVVWVWFLVYWNLLWHPY